MQCGQGSAPACLPPSVPQVQAEKAAWELARQHGIDLVTVLPNFVMGPVLSPASAAGSTSIGFMKVREWVAGCQTESCSCVAGCSWGPALHTLQQGVLGMPAPSNGQAPATQGVLEGRAAGGGGTVFCDVRDVARAHILAAENPAASGRYIVSQSHTTPPSLLTQWFQVGSGCSGPQPWGGKGGA